VSRIVAAVVGGYVIASLVAIAGPLLSGMIAAAGRTPGWRRRVPADLFRALRMNNVFSRDN
jgi:hypothetical protein